MKRAIWLPVILGLLVVGAVVLWVHIRDTQQCTIGVVGTAANITYQGSEAPTVCNEIVSNPSYGGHYYKMTEQPTGTVLCEADFSYGAPGGPNVHYIVRDTGLFDLVGRQLCSQLPT